MKGKEKREGESMCVCVCVCVCVCEKEEIGMDERKKALSIQIVKNFYMINLSLTSI